MTEEERKGKKERLQPTKRTPVPAALNAGEQQCGREVSERGG